MSINYYKELFKNNFINYHKNNFIISDTLLNDNEKNNEIINQYNLFISSEDEIYLNNISNIINDFYIDKLNYIQKSLKFEGGSLSEEYPEQLMSTIFLNKSNKVLEIGGNIGRNSVVIASIIDDKNLVVLEPDYDIFNGLKNNRDLNNFNFNIENSALSEKNMIQKGWDTLVSDVILEGYKKINTISYDQLIDKYKIDFDALVIDCEGAFYNILIDFPSILTNIKTIIIENDFKLIEHEKYVKDILVKENFKIVYCNKLDSPYNWPYKYNFYEVYKKII